MTYAAAWTGNGNLGDEAMYEKIEAERGRTSDDLSHGAGE